jgi:hypothetical protein
MTSVMGLDQHRAQITAEWIDTLTGEVSRGRIEPGRVSWSLRIEDDLSSGQETLCGCQDPGNIQMS